MGWGGNGGSSSMLMGQWSDPMTDGWISELTILGTSPASTKA